MDTKVPQPPQFGQRKKRMSPTASNRTNAMAARTGIPPTLEPFGLDRQSCDSQNTETEPEPAGVRDARPQVLHPGPLLIFVLSTVPPVPAAYPEKPLPPKY